jgi:RNA-binding motif X-linked protein 2
MLYPVTYTHPVYRTPEASWHADYRDTAYIYIGGLPFELSEGDIITIFSQFGEPVHVNLVRDKETGKSRGFAFLKYEDQRSTDLAVDNLGGATIMGRMLKVDHTRYKRKDDEEIEDNINALGDGLEERDEEIGGGDWRGRRKKRERDHYEDEVPMTKEERELAEFIRNHDDDDPMKDYLIGEKKKEIEAAGLVARENQKRSGGDDKRERHRHRHRHRHRSR